jgi:outer membrane receptor protein involved in Fe transport
MKQTLLYVLFFFLYISATFGQTTVSIPKGKITGKVTDGATKTPVEYATIAVYKQGSKTPVNGSTSDTKGLFTISNLPYGEYEVAVDFIGYQHYVIDHVIISGAKTVVVLNNIVITSSQRQLGAVNVVGKANTIENKIDKLVFNAGTDLTSQGGVATDILKKVPMVTVDIDGNVELQGNANVRFLINGKPSSIFGASLADALQSIPASQIKSIEVITSPGAKYDAAGTGGIINIILKDSKVQGINGTVNVTGGTRLENGSVNLNARKGNFGVGAFFSGNAQLNSTTFNSLDKQSFNNTLDTTTHLSQSGNGNFVRNGYQTGLNFTWTVTPKDELTASVSFDHFSNHNSGLTNIEEQKRYSSNYYDILSYRNYDNRFNENSTDVNIGYKKTFKKENQELDILFTSSSSRNTSDFSQNLHYANPIYSTTGILGGNPGTDKENDVSIDYTQPINDKFSFETGAKAVFETLNNTTNTDTLLNTGEYIQNQKQTYSFNYTRNIYAVYGSLTFNFFKDFFTGKAGLRYERTDTKADFNGATIPGYNIFAPSFVLSHKIDKSQSIKLSYSYRLERPDYQSLNPFFNISDPHNISTGNPNLKPELGHNYELGYNKSFDKGGNIYVAAFYRYNTDDLQQYTTFYPTLNIDGTAYQSVSLTQRYNLGSQITTGASLFGSVPLTSKLNIRTNFFLGERINQNPGSATVNGFAYRINMNGSYDFGHDLAVEVFGNYNAAQRTIQGTRPAFMFYNIALRKQFLNKKASLGLTAANPFNEYVDQRTTASGVNFSQSSLRQVPFRSFGISLSYKFGKLEFKKDKDKDGEKDKQDDQNDNTPPPAPSPNKQNKAS